MAAFGELRLRHDAAQTIGTLSYQVRPGCRGGALEQTVFDWAGERLRRAGSERGPALALPTGYLAQDSWRRSVAGAQRPKPMRAFNASILAAQTDGRISYWSLHR